MAKLTLKVDPTFPAIVDIPKAGSEPVQIRFDFKHRTKDELNEFTKTRADKTDVEYIMEMATGWDLNDEFNAENINSVCQNYIASPLAIYMKYVDELVKAKAKN
jgi:hypothetical protein